MLLQFLASECLLILGWYESHHPSSNSSNLGLWVSNSCDNWFRKSWNRSAAAWLYRSFIGPWIFFRNMAACLFVKKRIAILGRIKQFKLIAIRKNCAKNELRITGVPGKKDPLCLTICCSPFFDIGTTLALTSLDRLLWRRFFYNAFFAGTLDQRHFGFPELKGIKPPKIFTTCHPKASTGFVGELKDSLKEKNSHAGRGHWFF